MSAKKNTAKTKKVTLNQNVLVVGGGIAGIHTARELRDCGYGVMLVEQSDSIGGQYASLYNKSVDYTAILSDVEVLTNAELADLEGSIGSFTARIQTPDEVRNDAFGAVVVAAGSTDGCGKNLFDGEKILSVSDLIGVCRKLPPKGQTLLIGILLDMNTEETKASNEMAFNAAIDFRKQHKCEVYIFCREVRVSSLHLEKLYDDTREAGVTIIKYDGEISLKRTEGMVLVTVHDKLLDEVVEVHCHMTGISTYGIDSCVETKLADIAGISTDIQNHMQDNNIHLFPGLTNRPGIFIAGACRGQYYIPQIISDAKATALSVHALLSQKYINVELTNAAVDEDVCALCLTCIRSCPHKAMIVNSEKKSAESVPQACQKCGICAGECPAKAITLPLYLNEELLRQNG